MVRDERRPRNGCIVRMYREGEDMGEGGEGEQGCQEKDRATGMNKTHFKVR